MDALEEVKGFVDGNIFELLVNVSALRVETVKSNKVRKEII